MLFSRFRDALWLRTLRGVDPVAVSGHLGGGAARVDHQLRAVDERLVVDGGVVGDDTAASYLASSAGVKGTDARSILWRRILGTIGDVGVVVGDHRSALLEQLDHAEAGLSRMSSMSRL